MESIVSAFTASAAIIPYLFTVLLVYMTMQRVVKPMIRSHQNGSGRWENPWWMNADRFVYLVPIVLGLLCNGIVLLTFPTFAGNTLYYLMASLGSSWIFAALKHEAKERGIALPSDIDI